MKNKKISLHTKILAVSIFVMVVFLFFFSIAKKPTITAGEFPFSITYELDGKTVTISDVYKAYYDRNDGYADSKSRVYYGEIGDMGEGTTLFTLKSDETGRIELYTRFYPDYLMGDPRYDYFEGEAFEPKIYYYDLEEQAHDDEETLSAHGVKLIDFEYPTPIENKLVFSHLSYFSGIVVLPTLLISLLFLFAIMIFVKKDKELKYKAVDIVSIVLNFLILLVFLPFVSILAFLIDIEGGGPELYYQLMYFVPSVTVFAVASSIALRRTGSGKKSLVLQFIGPVFFALYMIVYSFSGSF